MRRGDSLSPRIGLAGVAAATASAALIEAENPGSPQIS